MFPQFLFKVAMVSVSASGAASPAARGHFRDLCVCALETRKGVGIGIFGFALPTAADKFGNFSRLAT